MGTFILLTIIFGIMTLLYYFSYRYINNQKSYNSKVIVTFIGLAILTICIEMPIVSLMGFVINAAGLWFLDCDVSSYTASIWKFTFTLCMLIISITVVAILTKGFLRHKSNYAKGVKFLLGVIFSGPILLLLVMLTATMTFSYIDNGIPPYKPRITNTPPNTVVDPIIVGDFEFLGEKVRRDNFDTCITVTSENIKHLYRSYDVSVLLEDGNDVYYSVESKRGYVGARYLSRIIKMTNNIQTYAVTYYGFYVGIFQKTGNDFLIGLNSPSYSDSYYPSYFGCKITVIDAFLNKVWERQFKYPELPYTYINKINQTNDGFQVELVNIAINNPHYFFMYKASLNNKGVITRSSKERVAVECPCCDIP